MRNEIELCHATFAELVAAFGDWDIAGRDDSKQMCAWDVETPHGEVEIYDYKVGRCYDHEDGLKREDITDWHVQGSPEAVAVVQQRLFASIRRERERPAESPTNDFSDALTALASKLAKE